MSHDLPSDPRERVVFCTAFGDHFDGDNFEDAKRYARFVVRYMKGMQIGPWAPELEQR